MRGGIWIDDHLLRLTRRWLALHERIHALLPEMPEPEPVRQARAILQRQPISPRPLTP